MAFIFQTPVRQAVVVLKAIQKHAEAFHPDAVLVRVADEQLHREFSAARGFGRGRVGRLAHDSTSSLIRRSSVLSGVSRGSTPNSSSVSRGTHLPLCSHCSTGLSALYSLKILWSVPRIIASRRLRACSG